MDSAIVEKIKNLLELARNEGATEGEANNAMDLVHKLLNKHNLELADVEAQLGSEDVTDGSFVTFKADHWRHWVCTATAELYYCYYFVQDGYFKDPDSDSPFIKAGHLCHVLGKKDDITVAVLMMNYFMDTIESIALKECAGKGKMYRDSFLRGIAERLGGRLKQRLQELLEEARKAQEQELDSRGTEGTNAMVLASVYAKNREAVAQWLEDQNCKIGQKETPASDVNPQAFWAGIEAGGEIDITTKDAIRGNLG